MMWIATIPLWVASAVFALLGVVSVGMIFDIKHHHHPLHVLAAIASFLSIAAAFAAVAVRMVSV